MTTTRTDPITELTRTLIDHIETHAEEWQRPWTQMLATLGPSTNATTNNPYTGANAIRLTIEALIQGYPANQWATYRQWQTAGTQVLRGEHATPGIRWGTTHRCDPCNHQGPHPCPNDTHTNTVRSWARGFHLFEITQTDHTAPTDPAPAPGTDPDRYRTAEAFIAALPIEIRERPSNRAYYRPAGDYIVMPLRSQFDDLDAYYGTLLHEATHWTAHPTRLNRTTGDTFGDNAYAAEELTAELAAALLSQHLGIIPNDNRHAAYLRAWLHTLGETPTHLYKVMTHAQAAADHLHHLTHPNPQPPPDTEAPAEPHPPAPPRLVDSM